MKYMTDAADKHLNSSNFCTCYDVAISAIFVSVRFLPVPRYLYRDMYLKVYSFLSFGVEMCVC